MNCYRVHSLNFDMKRTGSKDFSIASILADKFESRSGSLVRNFRYTNTDIDKCSLTCYLKCHPSDSAVHFNAEANSRQCNCELLQETVYNKCAIVVPEGRKESSVASARFGADIKSVSYLGKKPKEISLNCSTRDSTMHIVANFRPTHVAPQKNLLAVSIAKNSAIYSMLKESSNVSEKVATREEWAGEMDVRNQEAEKVPMTQDVQDDTSMSKCSSNIEIKGETIVKISSNANLDEPGKSCGLDREDHSAMSQPRSTVGFRAAESELSSSSNPFGTAMSRDEKTSEGSKMVLSPRREKLDWLEYTRYRPPKIPRRVPIGREKRRTPSMHPRIPFSSPQLHFLEEKFRTNVYLTKSELTEIASILRLPHSRVLPGLYVGNYQDSKDADQLDRYEITHILAIHDTARRLHPDKHYLCILAADSPDQNLTQYFSICNDFIHAARLRGGNVLIHCLAGMSRSVTVAVAYIMSTTNLSWKEALKVVRVGRSIANPNAGFQHQLKDFETNRLHEERRRLKQRFPSLALAEADAEACRTTLWNYESMSVSCEACEGKCGISHVCPMMLYRQSSKRSPRRKLSSSSTGSLWTSRTPPQTPRMLPSAPPSPAMHRSASAMSATRPRSVPLGLYSYTGSAPPSRAVSRVDLSNAVPCSSTGTTSGSLSNINRVSSGSVSGSSWRLTAGSAPNTPRPTPPVSPQRWLRRFSNRQNTRFPVCPESTTPTT